MLRKIFDFFRGISEDLNAVQHEAGSSKIFDLIVAALIAAGCVCVMAFLTGVIDRLFTGEKAICDLSGFIVCIEENEDARIIMLGEIIKFLILMFMFYWTLRGSREIRAGKTVAKSIRTYFKEFKIMKGVDKTIARAGSASASELIETLNKEIKEADKNKGQHKLAMESLRAILMTFKLEGSVNDAEESVTRQAFLMERYISHYFHYANFAARAVLLVGFAGTIIGIMMSMNGLAIALTDPAVQADPNKLLDKLGGVIGTLGLAFQTTLVAILCAVFLNRSETNAIQLVSEVSGFVERQCNKRLIDKLKP